MAGPRSACTAGPGLAACADAAIEAQAKTVRVPRVGRKPCSFKGVPFLSVTAGPDLDSGSTQSSAVRRLCLRRRTGSKVKADSLGEDVCENRKRNFEKAHRSRGRVADKGKSCSPYLPVQCACICIEESAAASEKAGSVCSRRTKESGKWAMARIEFPRDVCGGGW